MMLLLGTKETTTEFLTKFCEGVKGVRFRKDAPGGPFRAVKSIMFYKHPRNTTIMGRYGPVNGTRGGFCVCFVYFVRPVRFRHNKAITAIGRHLIIK